jgi:septal ring factor EnvC (AmiA/AmiB activator)
MEKCDFDNCPAKHLIGDLKNDREVDRKQISKLETKLDIHMAKSDAKHEELKQSNLEIKAMLKEHTDEEVALQNETKDELSKHSDKLDRHIDKFDSFIDKHNEREEARAKKEDEQAYRVKIMWIMATAIGTLSMGGLAYSMKKILDLLFP